KPDAPRATTPSAGQGTVPAGRPEAVSPPRGQQERSTMQRRILASALPLLVLLTTACPAARAADAPLAEAKAAPRLVVQLGHAPFIVSAALSPDGQWLLTTGEDKVARLWQVKTGREIFQFVHAT